MTRQEHIDWSKQRALAYLPGDVPQAMASFVSDLGKHDELTEHPAKTLLAMHAMGGLLNERTCRDLIEGTR